MATKNSAQAQRIETDIRKMATFSTVPGPGVTRFSYTPEHAAARDHIIALMRSAGLEVREDALGNITGRREGTEPTLPAIAAGSHFDSVRNGGMFDGTAGVICALEAARTLNDLGYRNRHPFEIIAIVEEEGSRFHSGMLGGRALAGLLSDEDLDSLRDDAGMSVRKAASDFGLHPENLKATSRSKDNLRTFIELHIEQGPMLEKECVEIGVVTSIVGIRPLRVTVMGRSDHAGTTPMHMRQDALVPAAIMVTQINHLVAQLLDSTVGTVGHLNVAPGGSNQVPGRVEFTVDLRSPDSKSLARAYKEIMRMINDEAVRGGVAVSIEERLCLGPVHLASAVVDVVREAATELGLSHRDMPSGAGHDSMFIAQVTDVGMIFVPSRGGRSHVPEEWTDFDDLRKGTDVMVRVLQDLDWG